MQYIYSALFIYLGFFFFFAQECKSFQTKSSSQQRLQRLIVLLIHDLVNQFQGREVVLTRASAKMPKMWMSKLEDLRKLLVSAR